MAGTIVHFELPSGDADRASGFWGGLFGWQIGGFIRRNRPQTYMFDQLPAALLP